MIMMVLMMIVLRRFCSDYLCDYDGADDYSYDEVSQVKMWMCQAPGRSFC